MPPHIQYPCPWTYTLIGLDEEDMLLHIGSVLKGRPHKVQYSKRSAQGKYHSLHVELQVESEEDRNHIFNELKKHPGIRMIL